VIGFISSCVTRSPLITFTQRQYSAIAHLHIFQFTVAHALGFPISTSRLLATDLNTELPQSHTPSITHKSSLHNSRRELTENYSRTTCKRASVSPINPWSDTRENRALLLLCHCGNAWRHFGARGGHVTHPQSCVIQVFIAVAWQRARRRRVGRGATRLGMEITRFRLLFRNRGNMFRCYSSCMA
jgi:hypothetical protein